VVGELAEAVRAEGLRFGVYYSGGLDWTFDDRPIPTMAAGAAAMPGGSYPAYAAAQVRELIERYRPSVLWNDITWPQTGKELWPLFAEYYATVPDGVLNDRWLPRSPVNAALRVDPLRRVADAGLRRAARGDRGLIPPKPPHFDVRTPEYTALDDVPPWPWESVRGIDRSFGFNRASGPEHFLTRDELLGSLADIVAKGGNLLLNVGPSGEAVLPPEQLERLTWLGEWTGACADALYSTRPWVTPAATSAEGVELRFTARGDDVFALALGKTESVITVPGVVATARTEVELLGRDGPVALTWETTSGSLEVRLPASVDEPIALALRNVTAAGG
jgi:alpha-L-fucosidase